MPRITSISLYAFSTVSLTAASYPHSHVFLIAFSIYIQRATVELCSTMRTGCMIPLESFSVSSSSVPPDHQEESTEGFGYIFRAPESCAKLFLRSKWKETVILQTSVTSALILSTSGANLWKPSCLSYPFCWLYNDTAQHSIFLSQR